MNYAQHYRNRSRRLPESLPGQRGFPWHFDPLAKNYLNEDELDTLNHLVSAYLDLAELQALRRKPMYMRDWIARLDDYLRMTDSEVLQNAGKVSHALAEQKAKEEYQKFKQMQSIELSPVEAAFVASIETSKVDELNEGVKKIKK